MAFLENLSQLLGGSWAELLILQFDLAVDAVLSAAFEESVLLVLVEVEAALDGRVDALLRLLRHRREVLRMDRAGPCIDVEARTSPSLTRRARCGLVDILHRAATAVERLQPTGPCLPTVEHRYLPELQVLHTSPEQVVDLLRGERGQAVQVLDFDFDDCSVAVSLILHEHLLHGLGDGVQEHGLPLQKTAILLAVLIEELPLRLLQDF